MNKSIAVILTIILFTLLGCKNQDKSPQSGEQQTTVTAPDLDLHAAIYMRDLDAIRQHIKAGSNLNVLEPALKSTPIITAAALGEPEAAKILIAAGADLNYQNIEGSTALHTAAAFGNTDVAEVLINAGADLNIKNKEGSTALHTAAFFGHTDIVKSLLEKGADKTIKNNSGATAYEIVQGPFKNIKYIYDSIGESLKPMGIELDYESIKAARPIIAEMLK